MTSKEFAEAKGLAFHSMSTLIRRGTIDAIKVNKHWEILDTGKNRDYKNNGCGVKTVTPISCKADKTEITHDGKTYIRFAEWCYRLSINKPKGKKLIQLPEMSKYVITKTSNNGKLSTYIQINNVTDNICANKDKKEKKAKKQYLVLRNGIEVRNDFFGRHISQPDYQVQSDVIPPNYNWS